MNFDQCGPYFRSANDCFIKSQTKGKSSNSGFRIFLIWYSLLLIILSSWSFWNMTFLKCVLMLQLRKKWYSSSRSLHTVHNRFSHTKTGYCGGSSSQIWHKSIFWIKSKKNLQFKNGEYIGKFYDYCDLSENKFANNWPIWGGLCCFR